jgi:hypothetical protein
MFARRKNISLLLSGLLLLSLSGCYDLTIQVPELPGNTPPAEPIYVSGNFNNWDPGDPNYRLHLNKDSVLEVNLPKGVGEVEYKFTRGDWSTVEKDQCGFEVGNRVAFYGKKPVIKDTICSWNDMPKPNCPSVTIVIESIPPYTPSNEAIYLASNVNDWDPGSRYWMFTRGSDGNYFIEVPRTSSEVIEYKITRGSWNTVESDYDGKDIDNRVFSGKAGERVMIKVQKWKDL